MSSLNAFLAFFVYDVLFWFNIALIVLQAYNIVVHKGIPNIRTAPALRDHIVEIIRADSEARKKEDYTLFDLGSGGGLLSRTLAAALPPTQVRGIEIARFALGWARFQQKRAGLKNLAYVRANFLDVDFSQADAIVMYLIPPLMQKIGEKLHREAKPGTLIISNKFALMDGWEPFERRTIKTLYLHQGELILYRV